MEVGGVAAFTSPPCVAMLSTSCSVFDLFVVTRENTIYDRNDGSTIERCKQLTIIGEVYCVLRQANIGTSNTLVLVAVLRGTTLMIFVGAFSGNSPIKIV
jgi:hypothetical protein